MRELEYDIKIFSFVQFIYILIVSKTNSNQKPLCKTNEDDKINATLLVRHFERVPPLVLILGASIRMLFDNILQVYSYLTHM